MKKVAIGLIGVMLALLMPTGCSGMGSTGQRENNTLPRQETDMGMEEAAECTKLVGAKHSILF